MPVDVNKLAECMKRAGFLLSDEELLSLYYKFKNPLENLPSPAQLILLSHLDPKNLYALCTTSTVYLKKCKEMTELWVKKIDEECPEYKITRYGEDGKLKPEYYKNALYLYIVSKLNIVPDWQKDDDPKNNLLKAEYLIRELLSEEGVSVDYTVIIESKNKGAIQFITDIAIEKLKQYGNNINRFSDSDIVGVFRTVLEIGNTEIIDWYFTKYDFIKDNKVNPELLDVRLDDIITTIIKNKAVNFEKIYNNHFTWFDLTKFNAGSFLFLGSFESFEFLMNHGVTFDIKDLAYYLPRNNLKMMEYIYKNRRDVFDNTKYSLFMSALYFDKPNIQVLQFIYSHSDIKILKPHIARELKDRYYRVFLDRENLKFLDEHNLISKVVFDKLLAKTREKFNFWDGKI